MLHSTLVSPVRKLKPGFILQDTLQGLTSDPPSEDQTTPFLKKKKKEEEKNGNALPMSIFVIELKISLFV